MNKIVIYIDIESLLDLRQGFLTYKGVDWEELYEYLNSIDYNTRETDNLLNFTVEDYREEVEKGNKELVINSTITHIITTLITRVMNISVKSSIDGTRYTPEVWLNVYPFKFSEEEIDGIKNALFTHIDTDCYIEVISKTIDTITPSFINGANMDSVFIYDFTKWINHHVNALEESPCTKTEFFFPSLYVNDFGEEGREVLEEGGFEDGFEFLSTTLSVFAHINFLPSTLYNNYLISSKIIKGFNEELKRETEEESKKHEEVVEEYLNEHFTE